jgi:hypothetical protein
MNSSAWLEIRLGCRVLGIATGFKLQLVDQPGQLPEDLTGPISKQAAVVQGTFRCGVHTPAKHTCCVSRRTLCTQIQIFARKRAAYPC